MQGLERAAGRAGVMSGSQISSSGRYSALSSGRSNYVAAARDDDDDDDDPCAAAEEEGDMEGAGRGVTELVPLEASAATAASTTRNQTVDRVEAIAPANLPGGCGLHCLDAHGRSVLLRVVRTVA
jgi:hypothetical protein